MFVNTKTITFITLSCADYSCALPNDIDTSTIFRLPMSAHEQNRIHFAGPRNAVGRASDSKVRGPGLDTRSGHILSFLLPLIQEGQLSVTGEIMCTKYWLTAKANGGLDKLSPDKHSSYRPGLATYFRFSFRFFKKGSCQLLAKVCARSTG